MTNEKEIVAGVKLLALIKKHNGSAVEALKEFLGEDAADKFITDLYTDLRAR